MLGIDVLASRNFDLLRGKRVGLITNHTAYTSRGEMTRVAMKRALGASLTTLYAPEHGIFGTEKAGKSVKDRRDPVTGLPSGLLGSVRAMPMSAPTSSAITQEQAATDSVQPQADMSQRR